MYLGVYAFIRYVFSAIFVYVGLWIHLFISKERERGGHIWQVHSSSIWMHPCMYRRRISFQDFLIPLSSASGFVCTHVSVCVRAYIMYIWRYVHMLVRIITWGYVHRFVCIIVNIQRQTFPNKSETSTYPLECVCIRMYPYSMRAYANIKAHISAQNI